MNDQRKKIDALIDSLQALVLDSLDAGLLFTNLVDVFADLTDRLIILHKAQSEVNNKQRENK